MIKHIGGLKFRTLEEGDHPNDFIATYGKHISTSSDTKDPGLNEYHAAKKYADGGD